MAHARIGNDAKDEQRQVKNRIRETTMQSILATIALLANSASAQRITVSHSVVEGIGAQEGVMRRDPSDIIKVDGLYYVFTVW